MLNPKGMIAEKERNLFFLATKLMLLIVVPVYILTLAFAWKYRSGNNKAAYTPDWDHHPVIEFLWWVLPLAIILVLAEKDWKSCHELDPFKPIEATNSSMTVQVVALQWKWLFIYPQQRIATVNFVQLPEHTPITFEITADAPMNSLWIPQLGGQIYAMPGMKTMLHLIASDVGSFFGSSANLSGKGFAGMNFLVKASSQEDFSLWVQSVQKSQQHLTFDKYTTLAQESENNPPATYVLKDDNLFDKIVMKYMQDMKCLEN